MVCARAHREGWVAVVAVIDAVWLFRYREPGHCQWMHEWEALRTSNRSSR